MAAAHLAGDYEVLYNGIVLPPVWPPKGEYKPGEPMPGEAKKNEAQPAQAKAETAKGEPMPKAGQQPSSSRAASPSCRWAR